MIAFKLLQIVAVIGAYFVHASAVWIFKRDTWERRRRLVEVIALYCRFAIKVLKFKVSVKGELPKISGTLLAGNHVSYLDVLVLSNCVPACFVTSTEVRDSFFLGHICRLAGCVFVNRKKQLKILGEVSEIATVLEHRNHVMVFPEATSTNGETVLRFRRSLFLAAQQSGKPVMPFCINYLTIDGKKIDLELRDRICWYGSMSFVPHLFNVARFREATVSVEFLPSFIIQSEDDLAAKAKLAHDEVLKVHRPLL